MRALARCNPGYNQLMDIKPIIAEMKRVFAPVPYGIEHTLRVLENAGILLEGEGANDEMRQTVTLAAILHDIGAVEAQRKYGSMEGHYQEIEGPPLAREILDRAGAPAETIERVCFIVGHHHTPEKIDGPDFQILWEADYLEYLLFGEKERDPQFLRQKVTQNFRTKTGVRLAYERLGLPAADARA
jgi:hypothetical protein